MIDDQIQNRLIEFTRTALKREFEERQSNYDLSKLSEVKLFKLIEADLDRDGQSEICFVAGIPDLWGSSICGLFDFQSPEQVIQLVSAEGFRDLQIVDINQDGVLEIVVFWQVGSGAFLSLYIFQWNGNAAKSLFPQHQELGFHQGFVELKDLDADGIDEIIVWEGCWEDGARWQPQRFNIHVFHYSNETYNLLQTQTSPCRYYPASIVSRDIGLAGQPLAYEHRYIPLEEYQQRLEELNQNPKLATEFLDELHKHLSTLQREGFYLEALAVIDLALKSTNYLEDSVACSISRVDLWRQKGVISTLLGDYSTGVRCYLQALSNWTDEINSHFSAFRYPGYHRELGFMYSMLGDYEHALASLSAAQTLLEAVDLSVVENRDELSRLYSNYGFIYTKLGDTQRAVTSFNQAITLDQELGKNFGVAINYLGLGSVQRTVGQHQDSIESYQAALSALHDVSERDRESDIYLELGLALIADRQVEEGLNYLKNALLLTSIGNFKQREAIHYLYLGLGFRALGKLQQAKQYFNRAIAFADEFKTPATKWQAFYGLALVYQQQQEDEACQRALLQAINTIEQLRSQYLPEDLKVSLFADKVKPYETAVFSFLPHQSNKALSFVERAKSRVFVEQLAVTSIAIPTDIPFDLLQQETELMNSLRQLQYQHRYAVNRAYNWGTKIDQIENRLERLWDRIGSTGSRGAEYIELRKASPLNFGNIKSLLTTS